MRDCISNCRNEVIKWITREKVKVDRVACLWLVKKFADPEAEFIFVPANEVVSRATKLEQQGFPLGSERT